MCRHVAWLGAPRSVSALMLGPEHGLLVQSYRPRRQRYGLMNADGWGLGFYADGLAAPARWRSNRPLWTDASFASVAPTITSTCVLGAVRSATTGMPADETAAAPFASGRWLLSHNGVVDRDVIGPQTGAESACDSAVLAAYVFDRGPTQVGKLVAELGARDPHARLNLLLANGERLLATTWGDTLSVLTEPDGVVLASEPYDDDPRWVDVDDRRLVDVSAGQVTITELES